MQAPLTVQVSSSGLAALPTSTNGGTMAPNATQLSVMERAMLERALWKMDALNIMNDVIAKEKSGVSSGSDTVTVDSIVMLHKLSEKIENESTFEESDFKPSQDLISRLTGAIHPGVDAAGLDGKKCADKFEDIVDVDEDISCLATVKDLSPRRGPLRVMNGGKPTGEAHTGEGKENDSPAVITHRIKRKPVPAYIGSPSAGLIETRSIGGLPPPPRRQNPVHPISIRDFSFCHQLGSGAQGKVYLAKCRLAPSKPYAIKVIKKACIMAGIKQMREEQKILRHLRCNAFIVNLVASFHNSHTFCLVTDFYGGGDLQTALAVAKVFSLERTRFYAAEMTSAIRFLHTQNILHRDIKLANVLLKADGHIAVADFGLSKLVLRSDTADTGCIAQSHCGTMAYMAPEHFQLQSYGPGVDWWSLGVCVFAMLDGKLPYNGDFDMLSHLVCDAEIPSCSNGSIDLPTSSFIQGLLEKEPLKRLGDADIFNHAFFEIIDWSALEALAITPPFTPTDDYSVLERNRCGVGAEIIMADPLCYDAYPDFLFVADEFKPQTPPAAQESIVQIDNVHFEIVTPMATGQCLPASVAAEFGFNTHDSDEGLSISVPEDLPSIPSLHSTRCCVRINPSISEDLPSIPSSTSSVVSVGSCGQGSGISPIKSMTENRGSIPVISDGSITAVAPIAENLGKDEDSALVSNEFTSVILTASPKDSTDTKDSNLITSSNLITPSISVSPVVGITPPSHGTHLSATGSPSGFGIVLRKAKALLQLAIKKICALPERVTVRW